MRRRSSFFVLFLFISLTFAGCADLDDERKNEPDPGDPDDALAHLIGVPVVPAVINSTFNGSVRFEQPKRDDCDVQQKYPKFAIRIYDQTGYRSTFVGEADDSDHQTHRIPLPGTGPWILAGSRWTCGEVWNSRFYEVSDGFLMRNEGEWDLNDAMRFDYLDIKMDPGDEYAEAFFEFSPYTWRLELPAPAIFEGRGQFNGEIRLYYPDGTLARWDQFSYGTQRAEGEYVTLQPGKYRIEVEAYSPVIRPTTLNYSFQHRWFHDDVCYFVDWERCR